MECKSYETDDDDVTSFNPEQPRKSQKINIPPRTSYCYYEQDSDDDEEKENSINIIMPNDAVKSINHNIILNNSFSYTEITIIYFLIDTYPNESNESIDKIINILEKFSEKEKQLIAKQIFEASAF